MNKNTIPVNPVKILVVRYRFIGDTVLTVPFLRNLKYSYPDAQIDMLVESISGEFLKNCPYINRLIIFENKANYHFNNSYIPDNTSFLGYAGFLHKEKYDKAFILKRSFSSALLTFLAGIPCRIGFDTDNRGLLLTKKVTYDEFKHESECFLDLLIESGLPVKDKFLEAWPGESEIAKIDEILAESKSIASKRILISAGASNPNKRWSEAGFAATIEELANNFDAQVYFIGTNGETEVYKSIESEICKPLKYPIISLLGKTSVIESVEFIKRMDLVIGVDSGILHLSASVNTPTISIFGPMNDKKWAPVADDSTIITAPVPCRPCSLHKKCSNGLVCLASISHHQIIAAAAKYLKKDS